MASLDSLFREDDLDNHGNPVVIVLLPEFGKDVERPQHLGHCYRSHKIKTGGDRISQTRR